MHVHVPCVYLVPEGTVLDSLELDLLGGSELPLGNWEPKSRFFARAEVFLTLGLSSLSISMLKVCVRACMHVC